MAIRKDITGNKYNKLTALKPTKQDSKTREYYWLWKCDCGNEKEILGSRVRTGATKSCGCLVHMKEKTGAVTDLVGQRFGRLVVEEVRHPKPNRRSYRWLCKCDCGNYIVVRGYSLVSEHTKSCGCIQKETAREMFQKEPGQASFNALYAKYKLGANRRDLDFLLTKKEFRKLVTGNCYYCGAEPFAVHKHPKRYGDFVYNGVDRWDSSLGYTEDNCVSCCKYCNFAKRDLPAEEFYLHIYSRYHNLFEPNYSDVVITRVK